MADDFELALEMGDFARARRLAKRALATPDAATNAPAADLLRRLGERMIAAGKPRQAAEVLSQAHDAAPDQSIILFQLGEARKLIGDGDGAIEAFREALKLQPHHREASIELIGILETLGRFGEAVDCARMALAARPSDVQRRDAVRELLADCVPEPAIERWLADARAHDRAEVDLRARISHVLLRAGHWTEAWPYYADRRIILQDRIPNLSLPEWTGRIAPNYGVLLRAEQGLGDTIMFSRFASLLGAMGANVLLVVPARLVSLLSGLPHVLEVLPVGAKIKAKNLEWRLLMDMPALLGVTPDTIPVTKPDLTAQPDRIQRWREIIPRKGLNVGIAWQGSRKNKSNAERSLPLQAFAPVAALKDVNLISLQVGDGVDQIETVEFGDRIIQPGAEFDAGEDAFLDSAGLIDSLDLVISCDSAVAHLSGAMGRPTFLALNVMADWRWLGAGDTTGWYPGMRLFRQKTMGDWTPVMKEIAAAVRKLARYKRK